ncbi:MAG: hypothetical protein QXP31_02980 [Pyrobaculum sp.]
MSVVLWAAGVAGVAAGLYLLARAVNKRDLCDLCFGIGLLVLGALSLVLGVVGYGALQLPIAPALGAIPPLVLSLGVVAAVLPRYWKWYAVFVVVGVVVVSAFRPAVMVFHPVAGLVLFLLPIYGVLKRVVSAPYLLVSAGALLIGVGGVALATIAAGRPLLPLDVVLNILPAVLLGTTVFMAAGALLGKRRA